MNTSSGEGICDIFYLGIRLWRPIKLNLEILKSQLAT